MAPDLDRSRRLPQFAPRQAGLPLWSHRLSNPGSLARKWSVVQNTCSTDRVEKRPGLEELTLSRVSASHHALFRAHFYALRLGPTMRSLSCHAMRTSTHAWGSSDASGKGFLFGFVDGITDALSAVFSPSAPRPSQCLRHRWPWVSDGEFRPILGRGVV
ncbi:hypothetical protein BC628DRAFT_1352785 [Trametes gibbosa]|nr:hypothetical protein BC628DRAFT_1352785 [Trametes gibbosa]